MAEQILLLCTDRTVRKTRHSVLNGEDTWGMDVFEGKNEGLIVAEVELDSPSATLSIPDWCDTEVTDDDRFYNQYIAEHPYPDWRSDQ